jgi:hypothetical protein
MVSVFTWTDTSSERSCPDLLSFQLLMTIFRSALR